MVPFVALVALPVAWIVPFRSTTTAGTAFSMWTVAALAAWTRPGASVDSSVIDSSDSRAGRSRVDFLRMFMAIFQVPGCEVEVGRGRAGAVARGAGPSVVAG